MTLFANIIERRGLSTSSTKKVNFDTASYRECFKALLRVHAHIQYAIVADRDRNKYSVKIIGDLVYGYVPQSVDKIRINSSGGVVLIGIVGSDWLY